MIVTDKKIILRGILIIFIAATLVFIWSNSLASSQESSDMSGTVVEKVKPIVDPDDTIDDALFVAIVRKAAHFTEFALLGAEMAVLFLTFDKWRRFTLPSFLIPVGICFICAVTDELLQLTSPGRACEFTDMMIDLAGIVTGVLFTKLVTYMVNRIKRR